MTQPRRILVTSALVYSNGPVHLGHMLEQIQTDIWVRAMRMRGHDVIYVCADDTHGSPVMLRAEREGIPIKAMLARFYEEHTEDIAGFAIGVDKYHTTHSPETRYFTELIYTRLRDGGHIATREVRQLYDPERGMFLPDRFVKGTCPRCASPNQNGDNCEVCGATYTPADLIDPVSVVSGARPVERSSEHYFVKLGDFETLLRGWVSTDRLQPEIVNKLDEWFVEQLRDWDISRDAPYFGFEIPDAPGKYFYVWFDAPIGYMGSFKALCDDRGLDFDAYWAPDSTAELYHFIGKDIPYFHCLFWPAMLHGGGFRMPTAVWVHGWLNVNGEKMSKSRGTFITARAFLDHLDPEHLRYYYAARLGEGVADIDLSFQDYTNRVNSDLVGKIVNIASRCSGFLDRLFDARLGPTLDTPELFARAAAQADAIGEDFEARAYNRAIRRITAIADEANKWIDERKPWEIARDETRRDELQAVLTTGLNLFRALMVYLKPVLPRTAEKAEAFLQVEPLAWADAGRALLDHRIRRYEALTTRVDEAKIAEMIEASKEGTAEDQRMSRLTEEPIAPPINYDEFSKIDLRVARVVEAAKVEGADKLLRLRLDVGGEERTVFAGIKSAYDPATLQGRLVVVVANLAPKKMRFGVSEGMVLAAGGGEAEIFLLQPDSGAEPGMRVR
ncbi:MAG TPA: methionine--tRNA ligase [Thermoanaerobaculia bacterium]|nr:methionine--tRNA ligase [Thermoanaerobaculia bacterium]